jgi:hypothetical protein
MPMEGKVDAKKFFVLQVECPSLLTDFNQTCSVCSACTAVEGEIQTKMYFGVEVECHSLLTDFNQTYTVCRA